MNLRKPISPKHSALVCSHARFVAQIAEVVTGNFACIRDIAGVKTKLLRPGLDPLFEISGLVKFRWHDQEGRYVFRMDQFLSQWRPISGSLIVKGRPLPAPTMIEDTYRLSWQENVLEASLADSSRANWSRVMISGTGCHDRKTVELS